jgi:hypothetical protein
LYVIAAKMLPPRKLFSVDPFLTSRARFFLNLGFAKSKTTGLNCSRPAGVAVDGTR